MHKKFLLTLILLTITSSAYARPLSLAEIDRLRVTGQLVADVEKKSLTQTIREVEKTPHPLINIEMKEAMAHTYLDLVQEFKISSQSRKEWVYSMVCLNMAYLQFGGDEGRHGSTSELNRLIRQKLVKYLPSDILKAQGFLYTLS